MSQQQYCYHMAVTAISTLNESPDQLHRVRLNRDGKDFVWPGRNKPQPSPDSHGRIRELPDLRLWLYIIHQGTPAVPTR